MKSEILSGRKMNFRGCENEINVSGSRELQLIEKQLHHSDERNTEKWSK